MTRGKNLQWGGWNRLLCLLLAGLLWLAVIVERTGEARLQAAVRPVGLPTGLRLAAAPGRVEVVVSGPRILLSRLRFIGPVCDLDLSGAFAGTADFTPDAAAFGLERGLKVVRVIPGSLRLTLVGGNGI